MIRPFYTLLLSLMLCFLCFLGTAQNTSKAKPKNGESVPANQSPVVKLIEYIVGTWKVNGVFKGDKDVSKTDTASLGERIEFNREGRYVLESANEKIDSGAYRLNEEHGILYLESISGGQPSEWNVWFRKNVMTLQPRDKASSGNLKYVYARSGPANRNNN
jgi:hypothetical protein